jgi:predicted kinase
MKKVLIMRGLPGMGKTTKVKSILESNPNAKVVSADFFFGGDNTEEYKKNFDVNLLKDAHNACFEEFLKHLKNNVSLIIVDNTNINKIQYEKYVISCQSYGYEFEFVYPDNQLAKEVLYLIKQKEELLNQVRVKISELYDRNLHGVPLDRIMDMFIRFEL